MKPYLRKQYETGQLQAASIVANAIRNKVIPPARGQDCVDCGCQAVEYDHRDYNKPLDVQPVCRRCNVMRGKAIYANPPHKIPSEKYLTAREVVEYFGGVSETSKKMDVSARSINMWEWGQGFVPSCRAEQAERLSGGVLKAKTSPYEIS